MTMDSSTRQTITLVKYVFLFFKVTFLLIGVGLILGAFGTYRNTQNFLANSVETQGTVIEIVSRRSRSTSSRFYSPVVEFRAGSGDTVQFTDTVGSSAPSYSVGEEVEVLYTATTPQDARIKSFFGLWGMPSILFGIGSIFSLVCVGVTATEAGVNKALTNKEKQREHLKVYGKPIRAKLQGVERNASYKVNGRSPYQLVAHWQDPTTSELYILRSENIWYDPTDYMPREDVTVLIDEEDPKKHVFDLSFLPKVAN